MKKLSKVEVMELIKSGENSSADFKEKYYTDEAKVDLIHDILCLANSEIDSDRYIVLGVDDDGNIKGLREEELVKIKDNNIIPTSINIRETSCMAIR